MKKMLTIGLLATALAMQYGNTVLAQNYKDSKGKSETVKPGNYTFNLVQYVFKDGAKFKTSELGKLVGVQNGVFNLKEGGTEMGTMELYDLDNDKRPDAILFRRGDGTIVSIGLDSGSSNYGKLESILGDRIKLYIP